jgi:hypothetical protein
VTKQAACTGTWTIDGVCEPNTCVQPDGSCCAHDGTCTVTKQAACTGTWTIDGVCEPNTCPCPLMGDLDGSGTVDGLDIQGFVDCFLGGGTNCRCGDFVPNGAVDLDDLPDFITALLLP